MGCTPPTRSKTWSCRTRNSFTWTVGVSSATSSRKSEPVFASSKRPFFCCMAPVALVQLNGDNFLFYNKSLGNLNVEKFTHKHPRSVDGVNDVWHAYPHSSRNLHDIGIARKLDWHLYKRLF